jgi:hypothetical protein
MASLVVVLLLFLVPASDGLGRRRPARQQELERVLMPFVGERAVADQYWISQFWSRNEGSRTLTLFFPFPCQIGTGCPPNKSFTLAPGEFFVNPTYAGTNGVFLHVSKGDLRDLAYTLRVEDLSGSVDPTRVFRGTELPLVEEARFTTTNTLLNVPTAGGMGKILRVYGFQTAPITVDVQVYAVEFDHELLLESLEIPLSAGRDESGIPAYPAFGSLDLAPILAGLESRIPQGRVTIRVVAPEGGTRIWSFVSLLEPGDRSFTAITPGR